MSANTEKLNITSQPGVEAWLEDVSKGAIQREKERILLYKEVKDFVALGLGALRVPAEYGGQGRSVPELLEFVREIAARDPNMAHALRNHFLFTEIILVLPDEERRKRWLSVIAQGKIFGDANSEKSGKISNSTGTRLERVAGGYLLTGHKYYSTGCIYSDWLFVTACDENGVRHWVMVPAKAEGVSLVDDWDGFGQRLTGGGSTIFEDVFVPDENILVWDLARLSALQKPAGFAQVYLTTVVAGILEGIVRDAVSLLHKRVRNFPHGSAEQARDDPLLLEQVGYLSAWSATAQSLIQTVGQSLQELYEIRLANADDTVAATQASLVAAQAKLVIDELSVRAADRLFEIGGASSVSVELGLDRHWRNARTIASHNPKPFKARGIGDYLVNVAPLPSSFF